jgi:hypothetical protein
MRMYNKTISPSDFKKYNLKGINDDGDKESVTLNR